MDSEYANSFTMMSSTKIGDDIVEISATYPSAEEVDQLMGALAKSRDKTG